jgi:hypothetical protein
MINYTISTIRSAESIFVLTGYKINPFYPHYEIIIIMLPNDFGQKNHPEVTNTNLFIQNSMINRPISVNMTVLIKQVVQILNSRNYLQ